MLHVGYDFFFVDFTFVPCSCTDIILHYTFSFYFLNLTFLILHTLCSSHSIVKSYEIDEDVMGRTYSTNRRLEIRSGYSILVGKSEGKRPLGRSRRSWEDNIKMGFKEI
jgi:hypothetical protein